MNPRPIYSFQEALNRMKYLSQSDLLLQYQLGTGNYNAKNPNDPRTTNGKTGKSGSDCAGAAIDFAYGIPRDRPGFNIGNWATVSNDINTNSAIEDAEHAQDLFEIVIGDDVHPGDLLMYPTIRLKHTDGSWYRNDDGSIKEWIGHVQMVALVPNGWTRADGWVKLMVYQCFGPNGRTPGVMLTDAHAMDMHDHDWPKPEHCVKVVRVKP